MLSNSCKRVVEIICFFLQINKNSSSQGKHPGLCCRNVAVSFIDVFVCN